MGFIVGPLIGAYFSQQAYQFAQVSNAFFTSPALFALTLAVLNVIFLGFCLQETLPVEKRVCLCQYVCLSAQSVCERHFVYLSACLSFCVSDFCVCGTCCVKCCFFGYLLTRDSIIIISNNNK